MIQSNFLCSGFEYPDNELLQDFSPILDPPALLSNDYDIVDNFVHHEYDDCSYEFPDRGYFESLPISDNFVSTILEDAILGDSDDWLSDFDNRSQSSSLPESINSREDHITKHEYSNNHWQSSRLWSAMSPNEQLDTLHALSELVTYHMTIREQMEIIKIIDPKAVISPDDKEFALDNSFMSDLKLKKIRDFIRKLKLPERQSISVLHPKKASCCSKVLTRKNSNISLSRTKRKQKKQKPIPSDVAIIRKRRKQNRKEEKSGLFLHETKVKLTLPLEDEEDVNILE